MTKLEHIENLLHRNKINIYEFAIDDTIKAMSLIVHEKKAVALNRGALNSKADETSVLAEELGHFETNTFYGITPAYNTPAARSNRMKCEGIARGWAYREPRFQRQQPRRCSVFSCCVLFAENGRRFMFR